VAGSNAEIRKTTNGGETWEIQTVGQNHLWLRDIFFTSAETGYIAGDGLIMKTDNCGLNWHPQSVGTYESFNAIFFLDSQAGYAVSYEGGIFHTTNGGEEEINNSTLDPVNFTLFPNPAHNTLNVSSNSDSDFLPVKVSIYSVTGQLILESYFSKSTHNEININSLNDGFYFIGIYNGNNDKMHSFIKN